MPHQKLPATHLPLLWGQCFHFLLLLPAQQAPACRTPASDGDYRATEHCSALKPQVGRESARRDTVGLSPPGLCRPADLRITDQLRLCSWALLRHPMRCGASQVSNPAIRAPCARSGTGQGVMCSATHCTRWRHCSRSLGRPKPAKPISLMPCMQQDETGLQCPLSSLVPCMQQEETGLQCLRSCLVPCMQREGLLARPAGAPPHSMGGCAWALTQTAAIPGAKLAKVFALSRRPAGTLHQHTSPRRVNSSPHQTVGYSEVDNCFLFTVQKTTQCSAALPFVRSLVQTSGANSAVQLACTALPCRGMVKQTHCSMSNLPTCAKLLF